MNIYTGFRCNMNCAFCSLHHLPGEPPTISWIRKQLKEHPELCHDINILGGEPSILPLDYQEKLIGICTELAGEKPYYVTNLLQPSPVIPETRLIVSYDSKLRPRSSEVLRNILSLNVPFALSSVMTNYLIKSIGAKKYLKFIEQLPLLKRADLLLYRPCTDIDYSPDHNELLEFVRAVMNHPKVNLAPYSGMKQQIWTGADNVPDHLAFMPGNRYGVRIDYHHAYQPFNTYEEAIEYYKRQVKEFRHAEPCKSCPFDLRCWSNGYEKGICRGDREMMELFQENMRKRKEK